MNSTANLATLRRLLGRARCRQTLARQRWFSADPRRRATLEYQEEVETRRIEQLEQMIAEATAATH